MSKRRWPMVWMGLLAFSAAVTLSVAANAQVGGKDKIGMPGGGCDTDFASKPNTDSPGVNGGCDGILSNDGMRGGAKRGPRPPPASKTDREPAEKKAKQPRDQDR